MLLPHRRCIVTTDTVGVLMHHLVSAFLLPTGLIDVVKSELRWMSRNISWLKYIMALNCLRRFLVGVVVLVTHYSYTVINYTQIWRYIKKIDVFQFKKIASLHNPTNITHWVLIFLVLDWFIHEPLLTIICQDEIFMTQLFASGIRLGIVSKWKLIACWWIQYFPTNIFLIHTLAFSQVTFPPMVYFYHNKRKPT